MRWLAPPFAVPPLSVKWTVIGVEPHQSGAGTHARSQSQYCPPNSATCVAYGATANLVGSPATTETVSVCANSSVGPTAAPVSLWLTVAVSSKPVVLTPNAFGASLTGRIV